jgi:pyruvate/2-oxoglutarate dehydrogenase complex dihydrolipoamide dehydrogenase (E3) component
MAEDLEADICVIGAGAGGLVAAVGAAQFGVKVILIERARMGGDCLNVGCVPSKSLLAAAKHAHAMRTGHPFGIQPVEPRIDHAAVSNHVAGVIQSIAPTDSVERMTGLGIRVIQGSARFTSHNTVAVADYQVKARYFVVATGSSPAVPPIPGLDKVAYFTNETIFENRRKLDRLLVLGGGPIGLELAQAHARLGSEVVVVEAMKAMGRDDPELAEVVLKALRAEGISILEGVRVEGVEQLSSGAVRLKVASASGVAAVEGTHLLVAAGRRPNIDGLNLDAAGVGFDRRGIKVGPSLLTSNPRIFAIGDVVGGLQFTHMANYHAGIVIRRMLFKLPAKARDDIIPWVTFTDPELAHVGLTEDEAKKRHGRVGVLRWPYHENDRARAERATHGLIKVVIARNGKILGATIVGEQAGELINTWSLAVSSGLNIKAVASMIVPYPTLGEIGRRAAGTHFLAKLAKPIVRKAVRLLAKLG